MMSGNKTFDCVQMKNRIQRRLQRRREGMSTEEFIADVQRGLAESDSSIAAWWRQRHAQQETTEHELTAAR